MGEQVAGDFASPLSQKRRREGLGLSLEELAREAEAPLQSVRAHEAGTAVDSEVADAVERALQRLEMARGALA